MTTRTTTLAAAAVALALAAAGCSSNCSEQTPPLNATAGVPVVCEANANQPTVVQLRLCPKCDQGTPSCVVRTDNIAQGQILLEPLSEVCDPNSGCPIAGNCSIAPTNCSFTAPAAGNYRLAIVTPVGVTEQLLTVKAGGSAGCSFP